MEKIYSKGRNGVRDEDIKEIISTHRPNSAWTGKSHSKYTWFTSICC
jgi:hypothetical protein